MAAAPINSECPLPIAVLPVATSLEKEPNVDTSTHILILDQTSAPPAPLPQRPIQTSELLEAPSSISTHISDDSSPPQPESEPSQFPDGVTPADSEELAEAAATPAPPGLTPPLLPFAPPAVPIGEIIARFKPSPRDIISGIAPHVFDERRRRRASSPGGKQGRRSSSPRWYYQRRPKASPLRRSVAVSWDEHSIYLDETSTYKVGAITSRVSIDIATGEQQEQPLASPLPSPPPSPITRKKSSASLVVSTLANRKSKSVTDSSGWRKFKLDGHLFKTLVSRIRRRNPRSSVSQ